MRDRALREWRARVRERADAEWRQLSSEVVDELATHLADLHAQAIHGGSSEDEARRLALGALANASFFELSKRPRARPAPTGYVQDLRLAFRHLRATPVVTIVAVLSLALGVGANTAIFSLVNSLLLRALPVVEPERLARVNSARIETSWTNPIWEQLRDRADRFDGAAAWSAARFDLANGGEAQLVDGVWVSGGYFDLLGVRAILGRTLTRDDDRRGGGADGPVAVIGYGFWVSRFGGSPDVIGRRVTLDRVPFTIVGVTPPGFSGAEVGRGFDVAIPLGTEPLVNGAASDLDQRSAWWLNMILRLKRDQTIATAEAALQAIQPQIREATLPPDMRPQDLTKYLQDPMTLTSAATGISWMRQRYERPLFTLLVVVGLVLLVACANIANLQLANATARRHEVSLRMALGASRWRLARQFLAESLLLSLVGSAAGLLFARWGAALIVTQISTTSSPVVLDLSLDGRVLFFTTAIAVLTAVLFGTAPALRASRIAPIDALKEQGRGADRRGGVANGLVVVQVALSLILVVAAGLFVRTFASLATLRLGFERDHVLIVSLNAPRSHFKGPELPAAQLRALEAVRSVPGVAHAALSRRSPVSNTGATTQGVDVPGGVELSERERIVHVNFLSSDWFATYRTPLLAGRDFNAGDGPGGHRVAIVNEAFVRKLVNASSPLGRTIYLRGFPTRPPDALEIVGVAADAAYRNPRAGAPPTLYVPVTQIGAPISLMSIGVRTTGAEPGALTRSVADAIAKADPNFVLTFRSLADQVDASLVQERLIAMLAGFFGALALLLAGLGLYGVTSYAVTRRRAEIGIRIALGAVPTRVVGLVLSRVWTLVAIGVAIGAATSLWASKFVAALLYGLEPRDPATLAGAVVVLMVVGGIAGWLPAHRAARIDPMDVLRDA